MISVILGPGQFNWDIALAKVTKVGGLNENATLQFRTEFFNAFNHGQFNNPAIVDVSKTLTFGQITSTSVESAPGPIWTEVCVLGIQSAANTRT